jgi:hypothetical protein
MAVEYFNFSSETILPRSSMIRMACHEIKQLMLNRITKQQFNYFPKNRFLICGVEYTFFYYMRITVMIRSFCSGLDIFFYSTKPAFFPLMDFISFVFLYNIVITSSILLWQHIRLYAVNQIHPHETAQLKNL